MAGEDDDHRDVMIVLVAITDESGYVKGNPYRKIALYSGTILSLVAQVIIDSFGFDIGKPFGFYSTIHGDYSESDWQVDSFSPAITCISLEGIVESVGSEFLFVYDFEDEWRFILKYIGLMKPSAEIVCPVVLTREGNAPDQYGPETWDNPLETILDEESKKAHIRIPVQKTLFDKWTE
jgi:hypothetical protein